MGDLRVAALCARRLNSSVSCLPLAKSDVPVENVLMKDQQISYQQFLQSLPPERRCEIERVWQVVRASVPGDFREEITPKFLTFKADDEWYVALASQKNYLSLYLTPLYLYPELKAKSMRSPRTSSAGRVVSTSSGQRSYRSE